jgi:hypothetical protein
MSYISPFNDMQNLDEHNHDFINQNTYKIIQSNVAEEDYVVNYGQGSTSDAEQKFVPLNTAIINFPITNDNQEETGKNKDSITLPNSSGDLRSPTELVVGGVNAPLPNKPVHVKNDVYIHWDPLTHFYFASLTVISLFVMFRSLQKSH